MSYASEMKKNEYKSLLYNLNSVKDSLESAISYLNTTSKYMPIGYSLDEKGADNGQIKNAYDSIYSIYKSLVYTVIPLVEKTIKELDAIDE